MTSMIERVARAICHERHDEFNNWTTLGEDEKIEFRNEARAAIEAMREPTGAMTAAGIKRSVAWEHGERGCHDEPPHVGEVATYRAMINAALLEQQP